ncbi:MAG: glycoside hydrolase family 3 N-terminal domain-containing protein, partial [Chlamydiota bacterium]|nr:glycoside hydrolase family 3 N-terminal domain-containing protein [Chlamydiota bacterium]
KETRELLLDIQPAGIILFSRNLSSIKKTQKLIHDIDDFLDGQVYFAIDHEGGLIVRAQEGLIPFAGNAALGATHRMSWVGKQAEMMAKQLQALCFQIDFAPVVDIIGDQYNPGITIRSFGEDLKTVCACTKTFVRHFQKTGMWATAKHFPGKGSAVKDAHFKLPVVSDSRAQMLKRHFLPFAAAIQGGVKAIMTTHVVYTSLEKDQKRPATMSRAIVEGMLRDYLGFKGLIYSDDMDMGAIIKYFNFEESIIQTALAGHEQILVCHHQGRMRRAKKILNKAYRKGILKDSRLDQIISKIIPLWQNKKQRLFPRYNRDGVLLYQSIVKESVHWQGRQVVMPNKVGKVWLLFPDLNTISDRIYIEKELLTKYWLESQCKKYWNNIAVRFYSLERPYSENHHWSAVQQTDAVILFCFNATENQVEQTILKNQINNRQHAVVVCMRNPYDANLVPGRTGCIQSYGFRLEQIIQAIKMISNKE